MPGDHTSVLFQCHAPTHVMCVQLWFGVLLLVSPPHAVVGCAGFGATSIFLLWALQLIDALCAGSSMHQGANKHAWRAGMQWWTRPSTLAAG